MDRFSEVHYPLKQDTIVTISRVFSLISSSWRLTTFFDFIPVAYDSNFISGNSFNRNFPQCVFSHPDKGLPNYPSPQKGNPSASARIKVLCEQIRELTHDNKVTLGYEGITIEMIMPLHLTRVDDVMCFKRISFLFLVQKKRLEVNVGEK